MNLNYLKYRFLEDLKNSNDKEETLNRFIEDYNKLIKIEELKGRNEDLEKERKVLVKTVLDMESNLNNVIHNLDL